MSTDPPTLAQYFPTAAWFQAYGQRLDASAQWTAAATGWGVRWEGGMLLQITTIPVQERTIGDLPSTLVTLVEDTLEWLSDTRLAEIIAAAPRDVRRDIDSRVGPRRERMRAALLDIALVDTTAHLWPALTVDLPPIVRSVFDQVATIVTNGATVTVFLELHEGRCLSVELLDSDEIWSHGVGITGEYAHWKPLVAGDTSLLAQMLRGQMIVDADMQLFFQYADAVAALTDIAATTDTRFLF